ncbi:lipid IV(A) 3-deoxy-D-manno-octulosonic acid transferase [Pseudoduganella sp. GCM10020061]|uniref:lipid IV(A) 3-deoxy-D-manno-octulosonic acid transferase n=1 Tax=Pseudoduganella sp. GCM10020061 TaxID=3317345 RepID=UPI00362C1817
MRAFYSFMWVLALPLVLLRLWLRGRKEPGYRGHWSERLGFYSRATRSDRKTIWVHAVSVGETRAAEPLVDALLEAYPGSRILLTHMTPTGRATGKSLFAKHGDRLLQSYLPYDIGFIVSRFIRHYAPSICILMETEVWPNLIATCKSMSVPVALVNARLSERSLRRGQRFGRLMTEAASSVTVVAAQTEDDAARIRSLGAPHVGVTGSIKFDVVVPQAALDLGAWMRERFGGRKVFLCASTRDGEEQQIIEAFTKVDPAARPLLLIVPRHPQRFDEVAGLADAAGLSVQRRSRLGADDTVSSDVVLGDSMGEMFAYYAACDVAFIGGSLQPLGGQNLIEACALGKPVLIGEHTFNFLEVSEQAVAAGGAQRVRDAQDLVRAALALLDDGAARSAMGERAAAFANQHRGATARTVDMLAPYVR